MSDAQGSTWGANGWWESSGWWRHAGEKTNKVAGDRWLTSDGWGDSAWYSRHDGIPGEPVNKVSTVQQLQQVQQTVKDLETRVRNLERVSTIVDKPPALQRHTVDNCENIHTFTGVEVPLEYHYHGPESHQGQAAVLFLHGQSREPSKCSLLQDGKLQSPGKVHLQQHFVVYTPILAKWDDDAYVERKDSKLMVEVLLRFVEYLTSLHKGRQPIITGFSYGGHLIWQMLARATDICCCAVIVGGYTLIDTTKGGDNYSPRVLREAVKDEMQRHNVPIKIIHSAADTCSPMEPDFWAEIENILGRDMCTVKLDDSLKGSGAHHRSYKLAYEKDVEMWQWAHAHFKAP